jgi:hypothetical protein
VVREIVPAAEKTLVRVAVSTDTAAELLQRWAQQVGVHVERVSEAVEHPTFHFEAVMPMPQLVRDLVSTGVNIEGIGTARQSLEEAFMALVGEKVV